MVDIKEIIAKSDFIITFGSFLSADNLEIQEAIIQAIAKNSAEFVYMHPIDNVDLKVYYSQFIKYEVGSEEGIASLLLESFVKQSDKNVQDYVDDLDIGYISAESSAGEEEFEEAYEKSLEKSEKTLILGRDIFTHERVENITKILSVIGKYTNLNIVCLDKEYQNIINEVLDESLEEVEELNSYNGTVIYRTYGEENTDILVGSESFARIAKVANNDEIFINCCGNKIQRSFIIDKNLYGTIALCAMNNDDSSSLSKGYRYKQVKIEKVDA
jgi:NADH-quinone oxidoreductase subunit F